MHRSSPHRRKRLLCVLLMEDRECTAQNVRVCTVSFRTGKIEKKKKEERKKKEKENQ